MARQRISSGAAKRLGLTPAPKRGLAGAVKRALHGPRKVSEKEQLRQKNLQLAALGRKAKKGKLTSAEKVQLKALKSELKSEKSTQLGHGRPDWISRKLAENARARDKAQDHIQDRDFVNASAGSTKEMDRLLAEQKGLNKKRVAVRKPATANKKAPGGVAAASVKASPTRPTKSKNSFTQAA